MTANQLLQYTTWAVYVLIFISTTVKAVRRPLRANIDIALFFLLPTLIILQVALVGLGIEPNSPPILAVTIALFPLLVYMLLRLVDDFSTVPSWLLRLSETLLVVIVAGIFTTLQPPASSTSNSSNLPSWLQTFLIIYVLAMLGYCIVAFVREARSTKGVTSRRMGAAAVGTIFLALNIFVPQIGAAIPESQGVFAIISALLGLASSIAYFVGFSPPGVLRSAWQEPELRAFLSRATSLPRLATTEALITEFERGAAESIGTPQASIGIWDEAEQALRFNVDGAVSYVAADDDSLTGKSYLYQKAFFTENLKRDSPLAARQHSPNVTLIAAPISTESRKIGVLTAYATHVPIFAEEDLSLITLLADQAAVIIESRALNEESMRVRTREEITRLKEDFLSAAAHDLKTPLTSLVGRAQLMERRAERNPGAPADIESIRTISREAMRLKTLVLELLDAARADEGKLLGDLEETDLVAIAEEVCSRHTTDRHPCAVEAAAPVVGSFDVIRIRQVFENLFENAVKYSPEGGVVHVKLWTSGDKAYFSIRDHGIGIPNTDFSSIFERFHRGTNIDDRRFAGMGLGLYICREIVKQHHGKISVRSHRGEGTTFTVELPLRQPESEAQNLLAEKVQGTQSPSNANTPVQPQPDTQLPNLAVGQVLFAAPDESST